MNWRLRNEAALHWHTWDDEEFLVYDETTGDTHLVNRITREALRLLALAPQNAADLSRGVADALQFAPGIEFQPNIERLLVHLDRLGLVEPLG